jgi:hypothetical protein
VKKYQKIQKKDQEFSVGIEPTSTGIGVRVPFLGLRLLNRWNVTN